MLKVRILCVGSCKENYLRQGCAEYLKRLGAFCRPEVVELPESKLPAEREGDIARILEQEGKAMLPHLEGCYNVALCVEGKQKSSPDFAKLLEQLPGRGVSKVNFIIGGSYGIWQPVKDKADVRLSLSEMTFPHQLFRLMLLEQVYRAFAINHHIKYHK